MYTKSAAAKRGFGALNLDPATVQTLAQLDPNELMRLAEVARSLQGNTTSPSTPPQAYAHPASRGGAVGADGRYYGVVKSFNLGKGFGFIACDQLHKVYGQDVFLHKNEFATADLYEGANVSFGIQINKAQQPQAIGVSLNEYGAAGSKRRRDDDGVQEYVAAVKKQRVGDDLVETYEVGEGANAYKGYRTPYVEKSPPVNVDGGPFVGSVKSYNESKGFGFITCDETYAKYSRDIFLHKNEADAIPGLKIGDNVQFTLQLNAQGNPQAVGTSLA